LRKVLLSMVMVSMASTLLAKEGTAVIYHKGKEATLYVDGKKSIHLTKELTAILLEEGNHTLKLVEPINEHCEKYGKKEVYISSTGSVKVKFKFEDKLEPTEEYKKVLDKKDSIKFQRFIRTKCNVVTDRKLGLMWQDDEHVSNKKRDLSEAKAYCQELEFSVFEDWRVPTYEELLTIVDYDRYDASIVPLFKKTFTNGYWSSSQDISSPNYAWVVDFKYGKTATILKSKKHYVRCVRNK